MIQTNVGKWLLGTQFSMLNTQCVTKLFTFIQCIVCEHKHHTKQKSELNVMNLWFANSKIEVSVCCWDLRSVVQIISDFIMSPLEHFWMPNKIVDTHKSKQKSYTQIIITFDAKKSAQYSTQIFVYTWVIVMYLCGVCGHLPWIISQCNK